MKNKIIALSGLLLAASVGTDALAQTLPGTEDGIQVPKHGENETIFRTWIAEDGHFILQVLFYEQGVAKVDFYDTKTRRLLFPDQEERLAKAYPPEAQIVHSLGLMPVDSLFDRYEPTNVTVESHSDRVCTWPYGIYLKIEIPGKKALRKAIAVRRPKPMTERERRFCEGGNEENLTTKYELPVLTLITDSKEGFFVQPMLTNYLIHFDRNGNSKFFSGRDDIVLVDPAPLKMLIEETQTSTLPEQVFIDKMDAYLDDAGRKQKATK